MKKIYKSPEMTIFYVHLERLIALSIVNKNADDEDALVKEDGEWQDIWD